MQPLSTQEKALMGKVVPGGFCSWHRSSCCEFILIPAFCILEYSINCIRRMYPKVEILVPDILPEMLNWVSVNYFHNNTKYFQPGFHDNLITSY